MWLDFPLTTQFGIAIKAVDTEGNDPKLELASKEQEDNNLAEIEVVVVESGPVGPTGPQGDQGETRFRRSPRSNRAATMNNAG